MADPFDPYKILQVDSEAEDEVIQAAYRRLARKYHPDLTDTPEAAARMAAINAAWELIGDPAARAAFDRKRGTQKARPAEGQPESGPVRARRVPQHRHRRTGPSRRRPNGHRRSSLVTGRRVDRPRAAGSTNRCARPRGSGRRVHRQVAHRGRCSISAAMPAGRSARSPATTSSTSSGWIERRSGGTTGRRSMRSCARAGGGRSSDAEATDRRGLYRRR